VTDAKMPTTDAQRIHLLHESASNALDAIRDELKNALDASTEYPDTFSGLLWGDHIDYVNAAHDQLQFCLAALGDGGELTDLDMILTMSRDDLESNNPNGAAGFVYGYADHRTPISDLMQANKEDDE
jgi:hypothetical protein